MKSGTKKSINQQQARMPMSALPQIKQDVLGRLSKITVPKINGLLPVFEAIANSYDSIAEDRIGNQITVEILRDPKELTLTEHKDSCSVIGFRITDNGKGFDSRNFDWFCEVDSMHKATVGGKGIGHLTWVKVFSHVLLESTFKEDGNIYTRKAELVEDKDIFASHSLDQQKSGKLETTITLLYLKSGFSFPAKNHSTLCDLIFCHFLPRILINNSIEIIIKDNTKETKLNDYLNQGYNELNDKIFKISGKSFRLFFLRTLKTRSNAGKIHYCAASRVVTTDKISNFNKFIKDFSESYAGYVLGTFLDENVLEERLGFKIQEIASEMQELDIVWQDIREKVSVFIEDVLKAKLKPHQEAHKNTVMRFVDSHPRYRTVLARKSDIIEKIPANAQPDEMIGIFEVERQKLRSASASLIKKTVADKTPNGKEKIEAIRQAIIDNVTLSKDTLADYVLDRKSIINLLESLLEKKADGNLTEESEVHSLIFPMRKTSDEVEFDEHNLWLIDERLAFHRFLTSDKPVLSDFDISSRKEPDILCYIDEPGKNNFSSATLIEFKRPIEGGRHYNPIQQLKDLAMDLQDNKCENKGGRKINFAPESNFFGYVISDFDDHLLKCIKSDGNLKLNPRGDGYFHYYSEMRLWLEVISYDKLLGDAEKRNQIFFQKLGLEN